MDFARPSVRPRPRTRPRPRRRLIFLDFDYEDEDDDEDDWSTLGYGNEASYELHLLFNVGNADGGRRR
ncbi:MAG: hypothetical protein ACYTBZ_31155, partial [Planctomycetota bacterium]